MYYFQHQQHMHASEIMAPTSLTAEVSMYILDNFKSLNLAPMTTLFYSLIHHTGGVWPFPYASHSVVFGCHTDWTVVETATAFHIENATLLTMLLTSVRMPLKDQWR
jgi:hypothetical protein